MRNIIRCDNCPTILTKIFLVILSPNPILMKNGGK